MWLSPLVSHIGQKGPLSLASMKKLPNLSMRPIRVSSSEICLPCSSPKDLCSFKITCMVSSKVWPPSFVTTRFPSISFSVISDAAFCDSVFCGIYDAFVVFFKSLMDDHFNFQPFLKQKQRIHQLRGHELRRFSRIESGSSFDSGWSLFFFFFSACCLACCLGAFWGVGLCFCSPSGLERGGAMMSLNQSDSLVRTMLSRHRALEATACTMAALYRRNKKKAKRADRWMDHDGRKHLSQKGRRANPNLHVTDT